MPPRVVLVRALEARAHLSVPRWMSVTANIIGRLAIRMMSRVLLVALVAVRVLVAPRAAHVVIAVDVTVATRTCMMAADVIVAAAIIMAPMLFVAWPAVTGTSVMLTRMR